MLPETHAISRPDEDIYADVVDALWSDGEIRTLDRASLAVSVHEGVVRLTGHLASELNCQAAETLAARVAGVREVRNDLMADSVLAVNISQALSDNPDTRPLDLNVSTFHGWVSITGEAPNEAQRQAVQGVAVTVPHVRGIIILPTVAGQPAETTKRGLQPVIGAGVYSTDGWAGTVSFVVIDPHTRLVTAFGAAVRLDVDSRSVKSTVVVPIEAVHNVSESGVFLTDNNGTLAARPVADELAQPRPPADWQPPFPYTPEAVRWPATTPAA